MSQAIHQFVAGYSNGDAISNEARAWRTVFRHWGCASEIYCEAKRILPELRKETRELSSAAATIRPNDLVILHLSIGSEANHLFRALSCRKAIVYHNITPPDYFRGYQEEIAQTLRRGREDMHLLADTAAINLADSQFNADELAAAGFQSPQVLPLLLDRTNWRGPVDRRVMDQYQDGCINILFVGRCAPNKRIEDLLFVLYYCQRYIQRATRLIHVGSAAGLERYQALLRTKARELNVDLFWMAGSVPGDELRAYYKIADVFLCMSEHEGFCIPLLEAMAHEVPVMAYDAGAVAETLGGAGILIKRKDLAVVAETIGRVSRDTTMRAAVIRAQQERLEQYERLDIPGMMKTALAPLLRMS